MTGYTPNQDQPKNQEDHGHSNSGDKRNERQHAKKVKSGVVRDTLAFGLQSVLPQLLSFILLPLFTSVLAPEEYAAVNLATVFGMLFSGLITLQLPTIIARMYFDCAEEEIPTFFSTVFFLTVTAVAASVSLITVFGNQLVSIVFPVADLPFFPLVFLAVLSVGISSISTACSTLMQVQKKATRLLRISASVTCVHFAVSIALVIGLRWGATGVLTATIISGSANLLLLTYATRHNFSLAFNATYIAPGFRYCLPLILHYYGGFLYLSSDKIVLEKFASLADVGIYAVAVRLATPMSVFVEAFNRSNAPRFIEMSKSSREKTTEHYKGVITKWFAVTMTIWFLFSMFAGEAVKLLTPDTYHAAVNLLPVLAASYVFRGLYCFAVNALFFEKKTTWIPLVTVSAGALNVLSNLFLIPKYGMAAAAWTTLGSFAVTFFVALQVGNKFYPMEWDKTRIFAIAGLVLFTYAGTQFTQLDSLAIRITTNAIIAIFLALCLGSIADIISWRNFRSWCKST